MNCMCCEPGFNEDILKSVETESANKKKRNTKHLQSPTGAGGNNVTTISKEFY